MQHPFIGDLSEKSLEDLLTTIEGLNSKLNFAYRMQNHMLIQQLNMALNSYKAEYSKRMDDIYKKKNIDNHINISKSNVRTNS